MYVFSNTSRRQAHVHLNAGQHLTDAALISLEGHHHRVDLYPHDASHYLVCWQQDLPSGTYQLAVQTREGQRLSSTLRIH